MAKKPSSRSKKAKKSVSQSAARGGGIMSLDKSHTSPFMKFVIIMVIIAFVSLFLYGGITGIIELFKPQPQAAKPDAVTAVKAQYDPQIRGLDAVLASNPTSYTLLVASGNAHFDYAFALGKLVSTQATAAAMPAVEQWTAARDAFKKAVAANKKADSGVQVDYAVATFYSGDTTEAVKIAGAVVKKDPTFAPAYFNLGIFYEGLNNPEFAIAAYQKYLLLDPTGKSGANVDFVKQQLKALGAPETAGASLINTATSPGSP
jgi:tetratricopeptide (TPR) repeat protein